MAIDDRLEKALDFYSRELETDLPKKALITVIAQIPHFGNEVNRILFGDAQRRVAERAQDVFEAMKERVEQIEESRIDKEFLKSDEFMTILTLAIEQLQTTHDKEKLRMLANALANSGVVGFSSDSRKELFMRIFRDLAPEHVGMLKWMRRKPIADHPEHYVARDIKEPQGKDLVILQNLAAHGLVDEFQEKERPSLSVGQFSDERNALRALEKLATALQKRCFRLNQFGEDFLGFFDQLQAPTQGASVPQESAGPDPRAQ